MTTRSILRRPLVAGSIATLLLIGLGFAAATPGMTFRGGQAAADALARASERTPATGVLSDLALTDQDGRRLRLRDHAGKVLLVNFLTAECAVACDQVIRELRGLQRALRDRMARDVVFLSIGVDPARDTPAALRALARRHDVDFRGWAFLTGGADELSAARHAFGAFVYELPRPGPASPAVEHGATTYLVDRRGVVRKRIAPGFLMLGGLTDVEILLASRPEAAEGT